MFTLKWGKCDRKYFNHGMAAGFRWASLSILETTDVLELPHITVTRVYTETKQN